ncbi:MAG: ABC transporter ATP-binding protein [Anaerolineae bacterium]|nr:ABC transporter ATP-binding protein [Anaerolineae bacterium]
MDPVIKFHDVSKRYLIGSAGRSLRSTITALPKRMMGRPPALLPELWALKDVSFEIQPGQSVGFLGHNGAGKTTVLKLLSGITRPTHGAIQVRGRVGTLIELGAGFHPEMTGRENVYLNGVILGMTRQEVAQRFDSIAAFAEIDQFLDTPVKRYSSGMYVRLAFAVAAHIDPAVLLVDEVLAVGDIGFRAKCYRRMAELRKNGTTVVLVSHDVYAIRDTCDRALLLWRGQLLDDGAPDQVINSYLARMQAVATEPTSHLAATSEAGFVKPNNSKVAIQQVTFFDAQGQVVQAIASGSPLRVEVTYTAQERVEYPIFRIDFYRQGSLFAGSSTAYDQIELAPLTGEGSVTLSLHHLHLPSGIYSISVVIADSYEYNLLDVHHQAYPLQVLRAPNSRGDVNLPRTWQHDPEKGTDHAQ